VDHEESSGSWADYAAVLRRRSTAVLAISGAIAVASVAVAFAWPPAYRSTATILIEEQDISPELVRSTVTTYAWQRIQTISQRVMTRQNLLAIVEKRDLFGGKRAHAGEADLVERMRAAIRLDPVSAELLDPRGNRSAPAMIAFTIAFDSERPEVARDVANELAALYLNENLRARTERATETVAFLSDEAARLSAQVAELETRLAEFKERNLDRLPELSQLNLQSIERTERDIMDTQNAVRSLDERRGYLEGQLAQLNPNSPMFSASGERLLDPVSRLKLLRTELAAASARYSPDHPDVLQLKLEIEGLEKQAGAVTQIQEQAREMSRLRGELGAARKKYTDVHPEVVRLRRSLVALERSLRRAPAPESAVAMEKPDNPAYVTLQAQLEGVRGDLRAMNRRREELKEKLADYEQRIAQTPRVEREYLELKRDYDNAQLKYKEIRGRQMDAQVGQELEKERKGERFSLLEPPQLPERPYKPNRTAILAFGFVLALGGGIGFALTAEGLDRSVHGARSVLGALGAGPLAVIPYMENSADRLRRSRSRRLALAAGLAALIAALLLASFWHPLAGIGSGGFSIFTGS
jgi:succinoglycan biosynthesis transport protein ExoP